MILSLHDHLFDKMKNEYDRFVEEVIALPPAKILDKAYEKVAKEDILSCFHEDTMPENRVQALLALESPLEELFQGWMDTDVTYMDTIRECIDNKMQEILDQAGGQVVELARNEVTAESINGEVRPGDWVLSVYNNDFAYLIGTVKEIVKLGTPEHARETTNDTDSIHVDFTAYDYPQGRISEIESHFSDLYGEPKSYGELPLDDVIMAPDMLLNITHLEHDEIIRMSNLRANCEAFCNCFPGGMKSQNEKHGELIDRLNENLSEYYKSLEGFGNKELIDMADRIAATADVHRYMTGWVALTNDEVNYYLNFQNPLEVVTDYWLVRRYDISDLGDVMYDLIDKKDALADYPLVSDKDDTVPPINKAVDGLSEAHQTASEGKAVQATAKPKQTLAEKLKAAGEKVKAQDAPGNKKAPKHDER